MANSKEIAASIVFAATVAATTLVVRVPIPGTGGYFNLGDAMVLTAALLFGWRVGAFAGGVGSALADLIGYPLFTPLTFVVKGSEGFVAGRLRSSENPWRNVMAVIVGAAIMVAGYFLGETLMPWYGGLAGAIEELPFNLGQAGSGIILSLLITKAVTKAAPELILEENTTL